MDSTIKLHGLVTRLENRVVCFVFSQSCLFFKAFFLFFLFFYSVFCWMSLHLSQLNIPSWLRLAKPGWSAFIGWLMDNSKRLELQRFRTRAHARINMDGEDSRASPSITDAHLTSLECAMPIPLQRPSGWQLPWWRMMFHRANERGPRRFITPVWATTFSRTYGRTDRRARTQNKRANKLEAHWTRVSLLSFLTSSFCLVVFPLSLGLVLNLFTFRREV